MSDKRAGKLIFLSLPVFFSVCYRPGRAVESGFYYKSVVFMYRKMYSGKKEVDMLNQEKTGSYIAEKRRQTGMTQKELVEKLGRSDKAVSKWERGKSMPDPAVMEELCSLLNISINEFLSGEDIRNEVYFNRAEENMKVFVKERSIIKRSTWILIAALAAGFLFILLGLYAVSLNISGVYDIAFFIDIPSLLFLFGMVLVLLVLSGAAGDFFCAFSICFKKRKPDREEAVKSVRAVKMVLVLNLLSSAFIFTGNMVLASGLGQEEFLQKVAYFFVPVWYGIFSDLVLVPFLFRFYSSNDKYLDEGEDT